VSAWLLTHGVRCYTFFLCFFLSFFVKEIAWWWWWWWFKGETNQHLNYSHYYTNTRQQTFIPRDGTGLFFLFFIVFFYRFLWVKHATFQSENSRYAEDYHSVYAVLFEGEWGVSMNERTEGRTATTTTSKTTATRRRPLRYLSFSREEALEPLLGSSPSSSSSSYFTFVFFLAAASAGLNFFFLNNIMNIRRRRRRRRKGGGRFLSLFYFLF